MSSDRKCPMCGSDKNRVHDATKNELRCSHCLFTDHAVAFPVIGGMARYVLTPGAGYMIHMPPQEVIDAVTVVQDYFDKRSPKWAFDRIQSRTSIDELPSADLPKIRSLAAAFGHDVVPRPSPEKLEEVAAALADKFGPGWLFMDEDDRKIARDVTTFVITEAGR